MAFSPAHLPPASDSVNPSSSEHLCLPGAEMTESLGTKPLSEHFSDPTESVLPTTLISQASMAEIHPLNEDMAACDHSPGGLKTMISSKSLHISFSRSAKVIFPFCSSELRNWTIWWVKARHFGTASWQTIKGALVWIHMSSINWAFPGACLCSKCFRRVEGEQSRRPQEDRCVSKGPVSSDMQICGNTYARTHILPNSRTLFLFEYINSNNTYTLITCLKLFQKCLCSLPNSIFMTTLWGKVLFSIQMRKPTSEWQGAGD